LTLFQDGSKGGACFAIKRGTQTKNTITMKTYFKDIPTDSSFYFGGNQWIKKSKRTAKILKPIQYSGRWFYFSKTDLCEY